MIDFLVMTAYGAHTKQPIVSVTVQSADWSVQMSPEDAQRLAYNLLAAAEASLNDAFLVEFMRDEVGASDEKVREMLGSYRGWRINRQSLLEVEDSR